MCVRVSRRRLRQFIFGVFITGSLVTWLPVLKGIFRPRTWTVGKLVHNNDITIVREPQYQLLPFPESPLEAHRAELGQESHNLWLAAIICSAQDVNRRMLIRTTWMRLFRHIPFDARFVVSNPGPGWNETIRFENRTFGDLVVLDHLHEDDITANTVKTLEFYKWLIYKGYKYEFITKLDTDLWMNAPAFWERYLLPRLSNETGYLTSTVNKTIIGELLFTPTLYHTYPQGGMYTVTWDMMQLLVSLQQRFKVVTNEDAAIGILMHEGREIGNFVNLRGEEKFNYNDRDSRGDGSAWARRNTHPEATHHALYGRDVIAVHNLKKGKVWMKVANCFDEGGIKPMLPSRERERTLPFAMRWNDFWYWFGFSRSYASRFEQIPKRFFKYNNGSWVCDDIWNLGEAETGFQRLGFGPKT